MIEEEKRMHMFFVIMVLAMLFQQNCSAETSSCEIIADKDQQALENMRSSLPHLRGLHKKSRSKMHSGRWKLTRPPAMDIEFDHTSKLLKDGTVLVAGGVSQIFDSLSGTWTRKGNMCYGGYFHPLSALLADGRVLVCSTNYPEGTTAETYDPETETWTPISQPTKHLVSFSLTELADGSALLIDGGGLLDSETGFVPHTGTAFRFFPERNEWHAVVDSFSSPGSHSASLLMDGTVLVIGECIELFDPNFNSWSILETDAKHERRCAVRLKDGRVFTGDEIFDPIMRSWTTIPITVPFKFKGFQPKLTLLENGNVLLSKDSTIVGNRDMEIWNLESERWGYTSPPIFERGEAASVVVLPDSRVLLTGGYSSEKKHPWRSDAEIHDGKFSIIEMIANSSADLDSNGISDELDAYLIGRGQSLPVNVYGLGLSAGRVQLSYSKNDNDSVYLIGDLWMEAGTDLFQERLILNIGGFIQEFQLTDSGQSLPMGIFYGPTKAMKNFSSGEFRRFAAKLNHVNLAPYLVDEDILALGNLHSQLRSISIEIVFNNVVYTASKWLLYKSIDRQRLVGKLTDN